MVITVLVRRNLTIVVVVRGPTVNEIRCLPSLSDDVLVLLTVTISVLLVSM